MFNLDSIPNNPGCYLYKDKKGIIIYVGKAKDLKKRVKSYFSGKFIDTKTDLLIQSIDSVEFFITKNEVEALLLENNLIKKHNPKYNVRLKDSKRYAFILMTDDEFPRLLVARDKLRKGKYFGPFVSADNRDRVLKVLRMAFKIRTCNKLPKRVCLRYHIKLCSAPCIDNISKEDYNEKIKHISSFLHGNFKSTIDRIKKRMKWLSDHQLFEDALDARNSINALESLKERQRAELDKKHDQDVINYLVSEDKVYLILFNVIKGMLLNKHEFEFDKKQHFLEEFMIQYYDENPVPREIIIPEKVDENLVKYLKIKRNEKNESKRLTVSLTLPKIGDKKELLDIAYVNLENMLHKDEISLKDLQTKLRLHNLPFVIECFDISNLSGTSSVGSMVQFRGGKPDKSNYRRFKIKTVEGIDDYAMIKEVVRRRYFRLLKEKADMPDLIMIDGGKGQLHSALDELKELGLKIPMISLAKKFEEVYVPGRRVPLVFDKKSYALKLLQRIRDEAHRFAIQYHRLLRSKKLKS